MRTRILVNLIGLTLCFAAALVTGWHFGFLSIWPMVVFFTLLQVSLTVGLIRYLPAVPPSPPPPPEDP